MRSPCVVDLRSHRQIKAFWPDVAQPFAEIVPAGCHLVRTEDEWRAGSNATRRRLVDLYRADDAPDLDELLEEACEDAFREGWTPLHDPGEPPRYELEGVILNVAAAECRLLLGAMPVLRVQFDQPWPPDYGPPVETSEMFQNLVRRLLRLGSEPERLMKTVILDPLASARADVLVELVEMPCPENLLPRFDELSFVAPSRPGAPWISSTIEGDNEITARVTKVEDRVTVLMEKRRMVS